MGGEVRRSIRKIGAVDTPNSFALHVHDFGGPHILIGQELLHSSQDDGHLSWCRVDQQNKALYCLCHTMDIYYSDALLDLPMAGRHADSPFGRSRA